MICIDFVRDTSLKYINIFYILQYCLKAVGNSKKDFKFLLGSFLVTLDLEIMFIGFRKVPVINCSLVFKMYVYSLPFSL